MDETSEQANERRLALTRKYERFVREMLGQGKVTRALAKPGEAKHECLDFGSPFRSKDQIEGQAVRSPSSATVVRIGPTGAFGQAVVLEREYRGRTITEVFGHLKDDDKSIPAWLKPGVQVSAGDIIGHVGNTGRSTGPHLHYETHAAPVAPPGGTDMRATTGQFLWGHGKPPVVDPNDARDYSDLSRYTFGIEDPRVRRMAESHIRKRFGQRRTGAVSAGEGDANSMEFDRRVRTEAIRKAAGMMSIDQLAKLGEEDFAWATKDNYWRQIMDPAFKP